MFYFYSIDPSKQSQFIDKLSDLASLPLLFASNFNFQYPVVRLYLYNEGIRPWILET